MKAQGYPTSSNEAKTEFLFDSIGSKGTIRKIVTYTPYMEDLWNLAFGDVRGKDFDDSVVSDNGDLRVVIQTVANTVYYFLEAYPHLQVLIEPVDDRRKNLYNMVFQKKQLEIQADYVVEGILSDVNDREPFDSEKTYEGFVVRLKKATFER